MQAASPGEVAWVPLVVCYLRGTSDAPCPVPTEVERRVSGSGKVKKALEYHPGELAVDCWCRTTVVHVSPYEILNMRTGSCGRSGCEAPG